MTENQGRPGGLTGTGESHADTPSETQKPALRTAFAAEKAPPGTSTGTQEPHGGASSGTAELGREMPCGTRDTRPGNMPGMKSRRSGRISKQVPILLIGHDSEGRVFTEETHTVMLSLHGAGIVSRHGLVPEQELILRLKEANREAEVRVVGEIARQGGLHTYGVAFLDEELDFWRMEFPPPPDWCDRPAVLTLECGGCRGVVELLNGDFEYDICAVHGGLTRHCEDCGMLTVWRVSTEVMPTGKKVKSGGRKAAAEGKPFAETAQGKRVAVDEKRAETGMESVILPIAEPAAAKEVERRSRVRAKVNFFACVRSEMFEEEIVMCIDMSRGGVSFRSKNCHVKETLIQIAVPFSPEAQKAPAIFVRGRIAHVKEMTKGMWRCGVEFLR